MRDAGRIAEQISELVAELQPAVVSELRRDLGEALAGVAECVTEDGEEALDREHGCGLPVPVFEDVESFAAGIRFAAQLVADVTFDY